MKKIAATALSLALGLSALGAQAADTDDWQFRASIYGWLPEISGDTKFPVQSGGGSIGVSGEQILDSLDGVFMGTFEAKKGKWGAFTDYIYLDLGNSKSDSQQLSFNGRPLPVTASANVNYNLEASVWTLAGTYEAVKTPQFTMDVLLGFRMLDIEQKLGWEVKGNIGNMALPGRTGNSTVGDTYWDGVIGVKGSYAFSSSGTGWFVPYYLDIGTGDSQSTMQAIAGLGYAFKWGEISAAWRYLSYDLGDSPIENVSFSGPAVGVGFRW